MNKLNESPKDNNFLFFAAVASVVLITAVFLFFILNNDKPEISTAPIVPKQKTTEEIMNDLSAPVKEGEILPPVSGKVIDSLSAPAIPSDNTGTISKKNKSVPPASTPVPKNIIDSLSAPAK